MIRRSFPSAAFALFSSPFKGEAGRGMGLLRAIHETPRRS
jgi:hypothetical protein